MEIDMVIDNYLCNICIYVISFGQWFPAVARAFTFLPVSALV